MYSPNILYFNSSIFTHDLYDDITGVHDIALVKLKRRRGSYINLDTEYVQPICLPSKQQNFDQSNCEVSGWGSWSTNGVQDNGLSLMGQSVNIDKICTSQNQGQICVGNPKVSFWRIQKKEHLLPLLKVCITTQKLKKEQVHRRIHCHVKILG